MDKERIISDAELSMEGFQVVRREFFAHTNEPSLTFSRYCVYVNTACFHLFENVERVQVLINPETYILALRPCRDSLRDTLPWCGISDGRRKPRKSTCKLFFLRIAAMMDWDPGFRYKLLGRPVKAGGETLLAFDLTSAQAYPLDGKPPAPILPGDWPGQFGLPAEKHARAVEVPVFDSHAVYAIGEGHAAEKMDDGSVVGGA